MSFHLAYSSIHNVAYCSHKWMHLKNNHWAEETSVVQALHAGGLCSIPGICDIPNFSKYWPWNSPWPDGCDLQTKNKKKIKETGFKKQDSRTGNHWGPSHPSLAMLGVSFFFLFFSSFFCLVFLAFRCGCASRGNYLNKKANALVLAYRGSWQPFSWFLPYRNLLRLKWPAGMSWNETMDFQERKREN